MERHRYKLFLFNLAICLAALFPQTGCQFLGIGSILGTESYQEKKIPAEYNLTKQSGKKILVLVDQPTWLDSQANLRSYLTEAVQQNLIIKTKVPQENLTSYNKLSEFRSSRPDFPLLSPVEVGNALGADLILLILVEDYQLKKVTEVGYFMGNLSTGVVLFDTHTGEKLWPQSGGSKNIKVGFEVETAGFEVAILRLARASAFCTTRYFYDCPKVGFKIPEDKTNEGWENWK